MEILQKKIEESYGQYLEMLQVLVNIDCGSGNISGVNQISEILREKFEGLEGDYDVEVIEQTECGNHLVISKKGNIPGKIMMIGHMDTVYPEGTVARRPLRIEGNRAYGPGVNDMKAGIVSIYFALKELYRVVGNETKTIQIIFNADEEISSIYSRALIERNAKDADYALILEPGKANHSVVTGRKGIGKYKLKINGKAAHAGVNPRDGANAIVEMAHKVMKLSAQTNFDLGTTVNVGTIRGGTTPNTVAEECEAMIDIRITNGAEGERIDRIIREITDEVYVAGTVTTLEGGIKRPPMEQTSENLGLYQRAEKLAKQLGFDLPAIYTGGGSDGNFTSALGIPTLDGLGPVGGASHSEDEYLELETITQRTTLLAMLLMDLSKEAK